MNANLLRQVGWLWKHRHKHDGEDFQSQITVIRQTVETQSDVVGASAAGAYIHLATSGQSIAVGGEAVEWLQDDTLGRFEFEPPTFPLTTVTIPKSGYYNLAVPVLEWESWTLGGEVSIWRNDTKVWPPLNDSSWSSAVRSVWHPDSSHAVWFDAGDTFRLFVDHGSVSAQTLAFAAISAYLVDRAGTPGWDLVFPADNFGITWDGTNWWTTDDTDEVNPALFKRSTDGTILNSYAGYDNAGGAPNRNRGIVYAGTSLWGVGNEDVISEINPATGARTGSFTFGATASVRDITYDGTNLFATAWDLEQIREFSTAGTLVNTHSYPAGHKLQGLAWDGTGFWATTDGADVVQMDAAFAVLSTQPGPTSANRGCHYLDGFLYVMTGSGLYRKAV